MDLENKIDVTGVDLKKFVQEAYALSRPQGLGIMHFEEGGLDDDTAQNILDREGPGHFIAVSMDYVKGRAVKMSVWRDRDTGNLYINNRWYDHGSHSLRELLARVGMADKQSLVTA